MLFWEREDFQKFIKEVDLPLYKLIFMTLYYMGLRRGELLAIKWDDVDLSNKTITINKTFSTKMVDYLKKALIYGHTSRISS